MKKILLLAVLSLGLLACSEDADDFIQYNDVKSDEQQMFSVMSLPSCFTNLTGQVHVDVSNGIGNPVVVFTPTVIGSVSPTATFRVHVEVQPLSDCDDMNSDTGTLLHFGTAGTVQNIVASPPAISVLPANMPLCYKWRFVFEGMTSKKASPICLSSSIWYESPLF